MGRTFGLQVRQKGTDSREKFQEEFEAFKIGVLIQEARKRKNLTQQQLADKAGTTVISVFSRCLPPGRFSF